MRIRVAGCSGTVPGPASPGSSYLVESTDALGRSWRVVLDLGSGALGSLQRWCDPRSIDAIALSHLHPDHAADLAALHSYLMYHPEATRQKVVTFGPFGTSSRIAQFRGATDPSPVIDVRTWQPGESLAVGPMVLRAEAVEHVSPAYAVRIEGPREDGSGSAVLAYSGDTDECSGLDAVAAGADVFLCEATYLESHGQPRGTHLTGRRAGGIAERTGARRLVLTHIPPWTDPQTTLIEARRHYSGPIEAAYPGLEIAI